MTTYKHLINYAKTLIAYARRLRREMTDAEQKLWSLIRNNQLGVKFRRQVVFDHYILDFYSIKAKLVIELDDSQHITDEGMAKDGKRDTFLKGNGLEVLRFSDADVLLNINGVMQIILDKIKERIHQRTSS